MPVPRRDDIRNVAVIAHVDHGKTTLVDGMLRQAGALRESAEVVDCVMDSNDLERERGITILAKNTAVQWGDVTINVLDTPGHSDFGGEVERVLRMADGVLLLVDAAEGPLPQTRFVLEKALGLGLAPIVCINKIDRQDARPREVLDEVYDLFIDLGVEDEGIDFPVLWANGRAGIAHRELDDGSTDLCPLFEAILAWVPPPEDRRSEPLRVQVNNIGWDDYVGRLAIGRVVSGQIRTGQPVFVLGLGDPSAGKIMRIYKARGLERQEIREAAAGDIITVAGLPEISIGDTIAAERDTEPLARIHVNEPTLAMQVMVNTGPFAGEDGKLVTSRAIRERLFKEASINVAVRVEETAAPDVFRVVGRGELQLAILVETMRREGFELMLGRPEVVTREIDGRRHEPVEQLYIDCDAMHLGAVSELLGPRKAQLLDMTQSGGRVRMTYKIPTRGLIGLHAEILNQTRGTAVTNTRFEGWTPWLGPIATRHTGSLVADRTGETTAYALNNLSPRGILFVSPGVRVYEGMVIGEANRGRDIDVNVCKEKKLTNMRAAGRDDNVILAPPRPMPLERCIEYLSEDEVLEVTPHHLRIRKRILEQNKRPKPDLD